MSGHVQIEFSAGCLGRCGGFRGFPTQFEIRLEPAHADKFVLFSLGAWRVLAGKKEAGRLKGAFRKSLSWAEEDSAGNRNLSGTGSGDLDGNDNALLISYIKGAMKQDPGFMREE